MFRKIGNAIAGVVTLGIAALAGGQQVSDVEFVLNPSGKTPLAGRSKAKYNTGSSGSATTVAGICEKSGLATSMALPSG